jgi:hypothetical protein
VRTASAKRDASKIPYEQASAARASAVSNVDRALSQLSAASSAATAHSCKAPKIGGASATFRTAEEFHETLAGTVRANEGDQKGDRQRTGDGTASAADNTDDAAMQEDIRARGDSSVSGSMFAPVWRPQLEAAYKAARQIDLDPDAMQTDEELIPSAQPKHR